MTTSVQVKNLEKVYEPSPRWMRLLVRSAIREQVKALDGVTFEVDPGTICAIVGANGAGKSTLFRILTGLTTPTGGSAIVLGMDPVTEAHRIRRQIGFMPAEDRTLFLRHSCRENLRFHGRLQGMDEATLRNRTDEMLDFVGLWEARDRAGFALSSGMKARLMFARAILHEPKVLILDEPTGAIDPLAASELLESIQSFSRDRGVATLISSHRVEEIEALRDNVVLLDGGRVVYWGDLETVRRTWERARYEISFVSAGAQENAVRALSELDGNEVDRITSTSISLITDEDTGPMLQRLLPDLSSVVSLNREPMPLRDLLSIIIAGSQKERGAT